MKYIMRVLFATYPNVEKNRFSKEISQTNYIRSVFLSKFLFGVSILLYLVALIEDDLKVIKDLNLVYLIVSFVIFFLFTVVKPKNENLDKRYFALILFLIVTNLLWASSLLALAPNRYEMIGTYSIIILSLSSILYFRWKVLLILHFLSLTYIFAILFLIGDFFFSDPIMPKITVIIFLNIISIGISRMLYYKNLENFELSIQLHQQNEKAQLEVVIKTEELTKSEEAALLILNSAAEGIYGINIEGNCTFVNNSFLKLLGYQNEEEVLGRNIHKLIHHSYEDGTHFPIQNCDMINSAINGEYINKEDVLWRKDGTSLHVSYASNPQIKNKSIIGAVVSFQDITERKKAEQKLIHSHELMSFVIEHNQSAVAVHDKDLNYMYVSQRYLKDYNVKEKDIIGKHHYDVMPYIPQKWRDVHQKALLGEVSSADNDPYIAEDGSKEWTRWECRPWYESDKSIGGIIIYTEVITKEMEILENLKTSEQSLKTAQGMAKIGSWELILKDMSVWGSEEAFNIYDLDRTSEFMDLQAILDMIDRADIDRNNQALANLIQNNIPYEITFKIKTGTGNEKYIDSKGFLKFDEQNKPFKVVGVIHDVTERTNLINTLKYERNIAQMHLDVAGVMMMVLDTNGNITRINNKGCEILELSEEEIIGRNWFDNFVPKDLVEEVKVVFKNVFNKDEEMASHYENSIIAASGEEKNINWYNVILYDDKKNIIGILSSGEDITKRIEAEQLLKESIKQNTALINAIPDILFILDRDGVILDYRAQDSALFYTEPEAFLGKKMKDVLPIDIGLKFESYFKEVRNTKEILTIKYSLIMENQIRYFEARSITSGRNQIVCIIRDVSDLKEKELDLEYAAYNDYLTGLYNRRYYEEKLEEFDVTENYPLTIVMADINGLKLINDAFGHTTGDELLISAANLMIDNCRETDLLARIGGDEFIIIMPNTTEEEAENIINTIKNNAKLIETQSIPLSISFGYKSKTLKSEDIQEVYRSSEDLMYREKLLEIPSMRSGAIETILSTLYEKDQNSELHSRSVSIYSERLAKAHGMNRQDVAEVKTAGLLHDIGKIIIPLSVINKKGKLTHEEYATMKNHPEIGFRILNSTSDMREISTIVLNHHERCDGKGYPRGIKGEEIPIKSKIIAIADAFDAMTSVRTYRDIVSNEEALKEILDNAGTQFNLELVKVFKEHFAEITAK